jgi:hypothetical protein
MVRAVRADINSVVNQGQEGCQPRRAAPEARFGCFARQSPAPRQPQQPLDGRRVRGALFKRQRTSARAKHHGGRWAVDVGMGAIGAAAIPRQRHWVVDGRRKVNVHINAAVAAPSDACTAHPRPHRAASRGRGGGGGAEPQSGRV